MDAWARAEASRLELASDPAAWTETGGRLEGSGGPSPGRTRAGGRRRPGSTPGWTRRHRRPARRAYRGVGAGRGRLVQECERLAGWHRIDLVAEPVEAEPNALDRYGLTPREVEVLAGLSAGRTNQEIADELFISVKTASVHVSNILRKLEVGGRQEAARVAHRLGV